MRYDAIAPLAALSVGGETRFSQLALGNLALGAETKVLDLCCGNGQTTQFLVQYFQDVTGLDALPKKYSARSSQVVYSLWYILIDPQIYYFGRGWLYFCGCLRHNSSNSS